MQQLAQVGLRLGFAGIGPEPEGEIAARLVLIAVEYKVGHQVGQAGGYAGGNQPVAAV